MTQAFQVRESGSVLDLEIGIVVHIEIPVFQPERHCETGIVRVGPWAELVSRKRELRSGTVRIVLEPADAGKVVGIRESVKGVEYFPVHAAVVNPNPEPVGFLAEEIHFPINLVRQIRLQGRIVREDEHPSSLPVVGSEIPVHADGPSEFGIDHDGDILRILHGIEECGRVRHDPTDIVVEIAGNIVRIEIGARCELVGVGVVPAVPLHEEGFPDSRCEKRLEEFEIIDISVPRPVRSLSGNRGGRDFVDLGGILEHSARSSRVVPVGKYIPKEIELARFLRIGDRCIISELCTGWSDIDIVSVPEDVRPFPGERDRVAPLGFGLDNVPESPVVLVGGDIAVRSALLLRRIVVAGMLDSPDTVEYPEIVRVVERFQGRSIGS